MEEARWGKGFSAGCLIYESFDRKIIFFVSTIIKPNRLFCNQPIVNQKFHNTLRFKDTCLYGYTSPQALVLSAMAL